MQGAIGRAQIPLCPETDSSIFRAILMRALHSPTAGADWLPARAITRFRLWAPVCREVELELLEPDGAQVRRAVPMARRADGAGDWLLEIADAGPGALYRYRLLTDQGGRFVAPDPRSRWQPQGPSGPSQVVDPAAFPWGRAERGWRGPGGALELGPICELHVGTFTVEGTFDAIDDEQIARLREAGYRSVELMPVHCFPGRRNWGYDPVLLFSPPPPYGAPDRLRALVGRVHAAGLAIGLDVVYNHFGPESNYHGWFGPYQDDRGTPWGPRLRAEEPRVLEFILDNVRMWINEYHFDFLRLDQTHYIGDRALEQIGRAARGIWPHSAIIAEDYGRRLRLTRSRAEGGIEFDAQWNFQFHHVVMGALFGRSLYSMPHDLDSLAAVLDRGLLHWEDPITASDLKMAGGQAQRMINYVASHDEIGNHGGMRLARRLSPSDFRLATALAMLGPGIPMFFMGDEYAEESPFSFFADMCEPAVVAALRRDHPHALEARTFEAAKLDPARGRRRPSQRDALRWFRCLARLRREEPALSDPSHARVHLSRGRGPAAALFGLLLEPPTGHARRVWLLVNMGPTDLAGPDLLGVPPGRWRRRLASPEPAPDPQAPWPEVGPAVTAETPLRHLGRSIAVYTEAQ